MSIQTNDPIGARAVDIYNALNQTILDLVKDPAKTKTVLGKSYTTQDLAVLRAMRAEARREAEYRKEIPVDATSTESSTARMMVVDPRGYVR